VAVTNNTAPVNSLPLRAAAHSRACIIVCAAAWLLSPLQDIADARALMPLLDAKVNGTELPHRDYAADCSLTYDSIMVRACNWMEAFTSAGR